VAQGGTCEQFDQVQAAYATLSGAGLVARGALSQPL
jgi:hypothetical protein